MNRFMRGFVWVSVAALYAATFALSAIISLLLIGWLAALVGRFLGI